ncbi:hypothetical protein LIER_13109 [Lithospermum erythrorhizon]|uniref:Uncharacterized protein n=1 Tax=Lithospermum erythrorhizon TaxID=34254 RepID=A0AAV3PU79_LITER
MYQRECPYVKLASPESRLESKSTHSSNSSSSDESSLLANSHVPKVTRFCLIRTLTFSVTKGFNLELSSGTEFWDCFGVEDKMYQFSGNQMHNYELRPCDDRNHTESSRVGEMCVLLVAKQKALDPALRPTQMSNPSNQRRSLENLWSLSDFAPAAPLPPTVILVPQVRPMLKRIAGDIPTSTFNPSKKAKKAVPPKKFSKVLVRDSEEEETHSQGVGFQVGPMTRQAALPTIVVDVASSDTLSDPGAIIGIISTRVVSRCERG